MFGSSAVPAKPSSIFDKPKTTGGSIFDKKEGGSMFGAPAQAKPSGSMFDAKAASNPIGFGAMSGAPIGGQLFGAMPS